METIINGASGKKAEDVALVGLRAIRDLARAALRAMGHALVHYSKASMLLRGGDRPFRRL